MIADRRAYFRKGLIDPYLMYYDALCHLLDDCWQPICGLRTLEEQAALYASGRGGAPGPILTRATPGLSFHNYGLASDWQYFVDGNYAPILFNDPKWSDYLDACEKVGVRLISWERPHNEYPAKTPVGQILTTYQQSGIEGVQTLLEGESK